MKLNLFLLVSLICLAGVPPLDSIVLIQFKEITLIVYYIKNQTPDKQCIVFVVRFLLK